MIHFPALKPKKVWKVPSKSVPGKTYSVVDVGGGELACDCYAGSFKADCRHKRRIRNDIEGLKYADEIY